MNYRNGSNGNGKTARKKGKTGANRGLSWTNADENAGPSTSLPDGRSGQDEASGFATAAVQSGMMVVG
ncbi:MAG: hypothetical protein ACM3JB_08385 [Acidobacteriaceae bacterium]